MQSPTPFQLLPINHRNVSSKFCLFMASLILWVWMADHSVMGRDTLVTILRIRGPLPGLELLTENLEFRLCKDGFLVWDHVQPQTWRASFTVCFASPRVKWKNKHVDDLKRMVITQSFFDSFETLFWFIAVHSVLIIFSHKVHDAVKQ